jgi:hypothetical protein
MSADNGKLYFLLAGERHLELAESILHDWATQLAEVDRDREAAACLRVEAAILGLRCDFPESEKRP